MATPLAGLIGMVIAFLVVRRAFVGKQTLDFVSNLGGAVPGTILGIGYILAFIGAPWYAVVLIFVLLAGYLASRATTNWLLQLVIVAGGRIGGLLLQLAALPPQHRRGWLALSCWRAATRCWR